MNVLRESPDIPSVVREYLEAILSGTLPEYYLKRLITFRDGYSSELPAVDVRTLPQVTKSNTHTFKCQTNVMIGITQTLRSVVDDGVVTSNKTKEAIINFLESDLNFQVGDSNNQARMDRVNDILDKVISEIR